MYCGIVEALTKPFNAGVYTHFTYLYKKLFHKLYKCNELWKKNDFPVEINNKECRCIVALIYVCLVYNYERFVKNL